MKFFFIISSTYSMFIHISRCYMTIAFSCDRISILKSSIDALLSNMISLQILILQIFSEARNQLFLEFI